MKDSVERGFAASLHYRKRLIELLDKDVENLYVSMRDNNNYEKASWAYEQADKLGEIKAIKKLISLLE